MTIKTMWVCDGCDVETERKGPSDWKRITLSADGFEGYPTCGVGNMYEVSFELCPRCANMLSDRINPRSWARDAAVVSP